MWPEPSLHHLLGICAEKIIDSTIYFIQGMYPSEEGTCGGPWGMDFCFIIFLQFMWDKARLDVPQGIQT